MRRTVQTLVLIIFALSCTLALTPVYDCNNGSPLPRKVQINDCEVLPCPFPQGSTVVMNATFKAVTYVETLKPEAIAHALGIEVNYPLDEPDGCKTLLNTRCPLDEGENIIYQLQMLILELFPQISFSLKFTVYGDGKPQFCFMIDCRVV